jgi:hypothetical protein
MQPLTKTKLTTVNLISNLTDELAKLAALFKEGLLLQEEFAAAKAKLLV